MTSLSFADIVSNYISFSTEIPEERLVCKLIDTRWMQRLRDISQTGNTRLVYMFSEHSRFGHSLGVAHLARELLLHLEKKNPKEVQTWRAAVLCAALLHDIGHLAPGSHTAFKVWYPNKQDCHEELAVHIIGEDSEIAGTLHEYSTDLLQMVQDILSESELVPRWCSQVISGAGWNVDRGNWLIADSVLAGVSYGKYNVQALIDSIEIDDSGSLALRENRLDAMLHFALSRHAMYRQVYLHRVTLGIDALAAKLVEKARECMNSDECFTDSLMKSVLNSETLLDLSIEEIFFMRESWWRYHLLQWTLSPDVILADLSDRLLHRKLLKTIRKREDEGFEELYEQCACAVREVGLDPKYYCVPLNSPTMHGSEDKPAITVLYDDGSTRQLLQSDPLFPAMIASGQSAERQFVMLPTEAKKLLQRTR